MDFAEVMCISQKSRCLVYHKTFLNLFNSRVIYAWQTDSLQ